MEDRSEYQGNGYGKAAFRAATEFASHVLRLKVWARCFRENTPSCRMILADGFTPLCEDDDFLFFGNIESVNTECALCGASCG